jgi:hypothetical protein
MSIYEGFSERCEVPIIPEGGGICIIEDREGRVLQVTMSGSIRRRIGQLLDAQSGTCVHGPKVLKAQQAGERIFVRWKLTPDYQEEKKQLMKALTPIWAP